MPRESDGYCTDHANVVAECATFAIQPRELLQRSRASVVAIDAAAVAEALHCGNVVAARARSRPPRPRRRVQELTPEAIAEFLAVVARREAENHQVVVVAAERVCARTER